MDRTKKVTIRIACIHALERGIQPLDFTSSQKTLTPWENTLLTFLKDLHKRAQRWVLTSEDLRPATMKLIAVLLTNMPPYYFAQHVDPYISVELCPRPKLKPHVYVCLLQLLRGRFYPDSKEGARKVVEDGEEGRDFVERFRFLTRPVEEEGKEVVTARCKEIADILFVRRKGAFGVENLDLVVEIVVQMAVHK